MQPASGIQASRCSFQVPPEALTISGGYGEGETPLPIPNREVKPLSADGTWPLGPGRVGRRRFTSTHEPSSGAARCVSPAIAGERGEAMLDPRQPGTGPARPAIGAQRRAVRVRRLLAAGHARSGELRVLQEDEGACEGGGAPDGEV